MSDEFECPDVPERRIMRTFQLPDTLDDRLRVAAFRRRMSKTEIVQQALERWMDEANVSAASSVVDAKTKLKETPYQNGRPTFMKAPTPNSWTSIEPPRMALVGIPYDGATSYRPGARMAPAAICEASMMLTDGCHPKHGIDPSRSLLDLGDIRTGNDHAASMAAITSWFEADSMKLGTEPIFALGGDHSITAAILAGLRRGGRLPQQTHLLIFDAHCDTWADDFGGGRGHGTWVRDVVQDELIDPRRIMQIGVRSPVDPETREWLRERGGKVHGPEMAETDHAGFIASEISSFTCRGPLYVSLDIDVLDPAFAPGTSTPECGGLSTMSMLRLLGRISTRRLIGADLVEVNPAYDPTKITALAGATLIWSLMANYLKTNADLSD